MKEADAVETGDVVETGDAPPPAETASKGEQTRRAVLEAAIQRFGSEGYRATSVATIARAASVGGTVPYAYFPNKEALFLAAVDHDVAGLVMVGLADLENKSSMDDWRELLIFKLLDAVEYHPLARRLLAGLEPETTARVLEIPALAELRKAIAARLQTDQVEGRVRTDIDAVKIANGTVTLVLSVLMSLVQIGGEVALDYAEDVQAVFAAALDPPR